MFQAIGRSRGGRGTKIHLVTDGTGRVLTFVVTPGQMGDMRPAHGLLARLHRPAKLLVDAAYRSNARLGFLAARVDAHAPAETGGRARLELLGELSALLGTSGVEGIGSNAKSPLTFVNGLGGSVLGDAGTRNRRRHYIVVRL